MNNKIVLGVNGYKRLRTKVWQTINPFIWALFSEGKQNKRLECFDSITTIDQSIFE